jgi:hypothetical protein
MFLKRRFGHGYRLVVAKTPDSCDAEAVMHAVQRHMFGALCEANTATELVFRVPKVRRGRGVGPAARRAPVDPRR